MPLGGWELAIVLVVAMLLFGGSRIAGIGKAAGRSIREFKDEVKTVDGRRPRMRSSRPRSSSPRSIATSPRADRLVRRNS
ncbi:twin-arginine translocase TatA/TatE family subunit [Tessaracoccus sp. HDW20]|uniref:twin-arginine translocase TatA/TatE family subunit n=1 Tax=Tessaracoccus coleopterorum TaxID=2714950 RepID=UPI0018D36171|nr:twin-arginine translocase TatA/TatE family subunit [Tessaracoccus coleopterorum]NHB85858.1 twin-arginine translocase TatA/TatE family subunit [Tessaracoccus coleopterorum]